MRDWIIIGLAAVCIGLLLRGNWQADRIDTLKTERDTARAEVKGYLERAELDRLIADTARAEQLLIGYRLAEIESRAPERITVYRDRVRVIEPLPAMCGPGAYRVAAVNEALR